MARALALVCLALAPFAAAAAAEPASVPARTSPHVIQDLERAPLVVVGDVRDPIRLDVHGYSAALLVERVLVGEATKGARLDIAWEELAVSRPVRFAEGDRVLVCLEPLPSQSIWAQRIPEVARRVGTHAVAERGAAFLRGPSPGAVLILEHYIQLLPDDRRGEEGAAYLAELAEGAELSLAYAAVVRLEAFDALGESLDAEAGELLVAALLRSDADATFQQALLDLFESRRPAAVRAALEARAGSDDAPALVLAALGRIDGALSVERARRLLEHPDPQIRAQAARHAPTASARDLAALVSADPAPEVRAAAVTRLVASQREAAIDAALAALEDPDPSVRAAAARALGSLGTAPVAALRHVVDTGSTEAAQAAVGALRFTRTREAHDELVEIADEHPDRGVRAMANLALGRPLDVEGH